MIPMIAITTSNSINVKARRSDRSHINRLPLCRIERPPASVGGGTHWRGSSERGCVPRPRRATKESVRTDVLFGQPGGRTGEVLRAWLRSAAETRDQRK